MISTSPETICPPAHTLKSKYTLAMARTTKRREYPYVFLFPVPVIGLLLTHPDPRKSTFRYNSMFNFIPVSFCFVFVNFRVRVRISYRVRV